MRRIVILAVVSAIGWLASETIRHAEKDAARAGEPNSEPLSENGTLGPLTLDVDLAPPSVRPENEPLDLGEYRRRKLEALETAGKATEAGLGREGQEDLRQLRRALDERLRKTVKPPRKSA